MSTDLLRKYPVFNNMSNDQVSNIANVLKKGFAKVEKNSSLDTLQLNNVAILPKRKLKQIDKMTTVLDSYFNLQTKPVDIAK